MNEQIKSIANKGKWSSISTELNRVMKYNYQSKVPAIWNDAALVQFRVDIESIILTKIPFCATPYCIGNLIC